jgi:predicted CXXCH cytochrome family protein
VKKDFKFWILALVFLVYLLVSCTPRLSNNFLTFFFDGVPSHDTLKNPAGTENKNADNVTAEFRPTPIVENKDYTVHYPYQEKECFSCHDENSKSELILPQPDLCYTCHNDFSKTYKYVHGPVAGGSCTSCHNVHMSKEKKLLIRTGQKLCLYCHDSKSVSKNEAHKDIADTECMLCHNPHGGENKFILN